MLLPYWTILTLMRKEVVLSSSTSWVFRAAPFAVLSTAMLSAAVLPLIGRGGAAAPLSHLVIVAGIWMLGAVFLAFGGPRLGERLRRDGREPRDDDCGVSRAGVSGRHSPRSRSPPGRPTVDGMLSVAGAGLVARPWLLPAVAALGLVALGENARYPVDNPATHLELTMVHEAMVLEYSGPYLALMELASMVKLTVFALLLANCVVPAGLTTPASGLAALALAPVAALVKLGVADGAARRPRVEHGEAAVLRPARVLLRFVVPRPDEPRARRCSRGGHDFADVVSLEGVFAGGMLLTAFFSMGRKRLPTVLRHYSISSACLAGLIVSARGEDGHPAEYAGAAATILVKVVLIPFGSSRRPARLGESLRLKPITRPVASYALSLRAVAGAYLMARRLPLAIGPTSPAGHVVPLWSLVFVALALIFLGFLMLIIRRDLFSQIIGFLTVENGISAFAVVALGGVPFLTEMGIFAVIGSGVVLMAFLSEQVHSLYRSHDTARLWRSDRLTCCCYASLLVRGARGRCSRRRRVTLGRWAGRRRPPASSPRRVLGTQAALVVRPRAALDRRPLDGRSLRGADDRPDPDRLDGRRVREHALHRRGACGRPPLAATRSAIYYAPAARSSCSR